MSLTIEEKVWARTAEDILAGLKSNAETGLTSKEAADRLRQYGANELPGSTGHSAIQLFVMQFADWMVALLAAAGIISALVGDISDTLLIAMIVFGNAIIGFAQEWKAEKAVDALRKLSEPHIEVIRDGAVRKIAATELTPGDIFRVRAGSAIPADARIVQAAEAEADESPLTGESLAVEKNDRTLAETTALPDRSCMLFCGTALTNGHATAVVTATGTHTELGRIARMIATAQSGPTPLQQRLSRLSKQLALLVLGICIAIFVAGVVREPFDRWNSRLISEMLLTAVSLAVAAIPEGLPAIVTVALALGSQRMAARNAIVRRLSAVETLGSVDVICSDKTGTLTQNRMTVAEIIAADNGSARTDSHDNETSVRGVLVAASLCNDARPDPDGTPTGTATEVALLTAAIRNGIAIESVQTQWPKLSERPFSSDRKRMSSLHLSESHQPIVLVKGAAERILERATSHGSLCAETLELRVATAPFDHQHWADHAAVLASRGQRVLAVAARKWAVRDTLQSDTDDAESGLTILGLLAIHDPVRPEAADAIRQCHSAGIHTVMITGDHQETARAVAAEAGLKPTVDGSMSGQELESVTDQELQNRLPDIQVFARVAPEHKLRIVKAWQANGAVVAMTGDGVNDAPALKQAEIGVAMGITGTDVSREASEMILADDNFATIVAAVEEGRVVYDNIRKFVAYLLTANISEILVLFLGVVFGLPLPLLPVQILWINLVTDGLPALALGFEAAEQDVMRRKPRGREPSIFSDGLGRMVIAIGTFMGACSLAVFIMNYEPGAPEETLPIARTMLFTTLALSQLFYVLSVRSNSRTLWELGLWSNYRLAGAIILGFVLQMFILYLPACHKWFHTVSLTPSQLLVALAASTLPYFVVESTKLWKRRKAAIP
ncbi:MAG: calcium-translocating P-type ATPase, PMCA-type [Planctomycetaceae bacterium]|nr:calcium-translocating P-type ATPase, PMCA-type [Planctomycetaceae bacterium]